MSVHIYDLVISSKINNNVRKIISNNRMTKEESELTLDEIYSILYKAILDLDKTAEQSVIVNELPEEKFSDENAIQLNNILSSLESLGTKIELIEVKNAQSEQSDEGYLCYMKLESNSIIPSCYSANLFSYTDESTTISEIEVQLAELVIGNQTSREVLNIDSIKNMIIANKKLGIPYYNDELESILKSYKVEFEVLGDF